MPTSIRPAAPPHPGEQLRRLLSQFGPPLGREGLSADRLAGYFRPLVSRAVRAGRGALAPWVARQLGGVPPGANPTRLVGELTHRLVQLFLVPADGGRETVIDRRAEG